MQEKILKLGMRSEPVAPDAPRDPLQRAALDGSSSVIADLAKGGADLNARFERSWTALHIGSAHNHPNFVDALLQYGADTELRLGDSSTSLHISATNGNDKVVEVLLRHGARLDAKRDGGGFTALHLAAIRDRRDALRVLIDASVNGTSNIDEPADDRETALSCACSSGHLECVKMLASAGADVNAIVDPQGRTPLMNAATVDQDQVAQVLVDALADIDRVHNTGITAVEIAAFSGSVKVLQVLISGGANLDSMDRNGYTPLRAAIVGKHPEAAMLLLQHRLRINTAYGDNEDTALHLAVAHNYRNVVEALAAKGADVGACDRDGDTPLQWAVEKGRLDMSKDLLRHGALVNKPNEKTGEVVLHWAVRCGHVAVTELLLARKADTSVVDLTQIQKAESADEEDFATCKILVETASVSGARELPQAEPSSSSVPTESEHSRPSSPGTGSSLAGPHQFIRYEILDIPSQYAAERAVRELVGSVEHGGVRCDGPLCKGKSENIKGIRFKCVLCENTDFCSACVASFHNNHDATHAVIRCSLPTQFHLIKEIDDKTKRSWLDACGEPSAAIEDLSHIVYALPDKQSLQLQLDWTEQQHQKCAEIEQLLQESRPAIFPVVGSSSKEYVAANTRRSDIMDYGGSTEPDGIASYKIDEVGNVRVKNYNKDEPQSTPRDDDVLVHHRDPELLTRAVTGMLKHYDYSEVKTFRKWAWEDRIVTRVIDIKPGNFDDKLEIDIRVVDLDTWPTYEALSYTWKETAYERAVVSNWTRETSETARKMAKFLHAVYCNDESGRERFLEINCGLRDALTRLRDPSETKTYWVDQLSINQRDHGERKFQVSGMVFFYNRARQVTLWAGDEDGNTSEVFDIFRTIAQACNNGQGLFPDPGEMLADPRSRLPPFDSAIWRSVLDFFNRPVFTRCWVIQEVVVGQRVIVRCGQCIIDWADLSRVAQTFGQRPWMEKLLYDSLANGRESLLSLSTNLEGKDIRQTGSLNVVMVNGLREDFQVLKENSLEILLYSTSFFQATDPRDKIYSVLGIQSANDIRRFLKEIEPDYQKPVEDVFLNAARVCILQSSSLTICGINNGLSSKGMNQLPSWVPDFTANIMDSTTSLCRPKPRNPYHACGDIPLAAAWPYEDRPDLLVTSSCKIETVASVSQHFLSSTDILPKLVMEWTKMASIGPHYPTGEFTPDVFCRTCVADAMGPWRLSPMPELLHKPLCRLYEGCFYQHIARESATNKAAEELVAQEFCDNGVLGTLINDVRRAPKPDERQPSTSSPPDADTDGESSGGDAAIDVMMAVEAMLQACRNKRFFVTGNGYIGVGVRDTQVGDEVHVLSGTSVPFVLRRLGSDNEESGAQNDERARTTREMVEEDDMRLYNMVGEVYIHGYMQGQVAGAEGVEWEGICIW